jgi:hypothetical protein
MNNRIPIGVTLFGGGLERNGKNTEYIYLCLKAQMASEDGKHREAAEYYERASWIADELKAPIQAQQMQDNAQRERKKESQENRRSFVLSK